MEYSGPGSQNLNANSNNCPALFYLVYFDFVLSNVEKSGLGILSTQRSNVPQTHGSTCYEWDNTPVFPPVSAITIRRNPTVSVHITEYSVLKGTHW